MFNNLPNEIIIHIYEYSSERFTDKILSDIILKGFLFSYKKSKSDKIIFNQYNFSNIYNIINILNNCKCCERHNINKPFSPHDISWFLSSLKSKKNKNKCKCLCRHASRCMQRIQLRYLHNLDDDNDGEDIN